VKEIVEEESVSIVRACRATELNRSMFYYSTVLDDREVETKLREYAERLPAGGFPEYYKRIRKEGFKWNHKRVGRVYIKLGMSRRRRVKRRIPNPEKTPLLQPISSNLTWSIDFMDDRLINGRKFRTLNMIDDYNREALAVDIEFSFPSERVVERIKDIIEWKGKPDEIRSDNGTEFVAKSFEAFCNEFKIKHIRSQKGRPMQDGYIERFNRTYRENVLNMNLFDNLNQVMELTEAFVDDYNNNHPHKSLGDKSPVSFSRDRNKNVTLSSV